MPGHLAQADQGASDGGKEPPSGPLAVNWPPHWMQPGTISGLWSDLWEELKINSKLMKPSLQLSAVRQATDGGIVPHAATPPPVSQPALSVME